MRIVRTLLLPLLFASALFIPAVAAASSPASPAPSAHQAWVIEHHALEVENHQDIHQAKVRHAHLLRVAAAHRKWLAIYMAPVIRVGHCEEPLTAGGRIIGVNWHYQDSSFSGGLGWRPATWAEFKAPGDPAYMSQASPLVQAKAMHRFAEHYYWPDVSGCAGY